MSYIADTFGLGEFQRLYLSYLVWLLFSSCPLYLSFLQSIYRSSACST